MALSKEQSRELRSLFPGYSSRISNPVAGLYLGRVNCLGFALAAYAADPEGSRVVGITSAPEDGLAPSKYSGIYCHFATVSRLGKGGLQVAEMLGRGPKVRNFNSFQVERRKNFALLESRKLATGLEMAARAGAGDFEYHSTNTSRFIPWKLTVETIKNPDEMLAKLSGCRSMENFGVELSAQASYNRLYNGYNSES